jgi:hypothetical protein
MSKPNDYEAYMRKFMSYGDNFEYEKGHIYPEDQLLLITPKGICDYFHFKAYNKTCPNEGDRPKGLRSSSSLTYVKKAISSFLHVGSNSEEKKPNKIG